VRHAASLGVVDPVPGPASWALLDREPGGAVRFGAPAAAAPSPPPTPATVDEVAEETAERPRRGTTGPTRGRVIAVWGPAGAPGRTSLAIAIAAELAGAGRSVAVADADTHAAAVAPALGLLDEAPGFAAACRLAGTGGLTVAELDRVAVPHRGGFRVLTGLGRPSRWPEITAERVAGVLGAVRDWVDETVVDVAASLEQDEEISSDLLAAPRRNAATLEALRSADRVVVVGAGDPVGLARLLRGHAELADLVPVERLLVVVNKVRPAAIGLDAGTQIRQTLERFGGIREPVLVPWDPAAFDAALVSARTLAEAAPRSSARTAVRKLVADRLGVALPAKPRFRFAG
jgi:MinD-like ATPase involved in chromosome partitioning or flagellar assembly